MRKSMVNLIVKNERMDEIRVCEERVFFRVQNQKPFLFVLTEKQRK